jgi:hypothetical protein
MQQHDIRSAARDLVDKLYVTAAQNRHGKSTILYPVIFLAVASHIPGRLLKYA